MEIVVTKIPEPKQKDEMFWFEFEWNQVRFLWKTLEPSIASWVFLLYDKLKNVSEQNTNLKRKNKSYIQKLNDIDVYNHNRKEHLAGVLRKCENVEIQNRALIEYAKVLKKKVLKAEAK